MLKSIVAAAIALAALTAAPAHAQQSPLCGPTAKLVETLGADHGEVMAAGGIDASGHRLLVFANIETGTFTILLTPPGAPFSCVVSSGEGFAIERPVPQGQPS